MHRRVGGVVLIALLVIASIPVSAGSAAAAPAPPPPSHDVIGWVNGYWYNQSINVDQSDGLSQQELTAYVSRTEARIEVLTGKQFNGTIPVSIIDRKSYGNQTTGNASANYTAWNNQVWEALFIVGEDQNIEQVLHSTATSATAGAYRYGPNDIQIVTNSPKDVSIDHGTLAHELTHALQNQYYNLSSPKYAAQTQDGQLATNGLIEGEANYIEARYNAKCGHEWSCVSSPPSISVGSGGNINAGVYLILINPYSDGPPYVNHLVQQGGWSAVDAAFANPPVSSEQIIHQTTQRPAPLSIATDATAGWEPFPHQGRNGTDTAGEASIFSMFFYQAQTAGAKTGVYSLGDPKNLGPYDIYNYSAAPSAGWGNDAILPYHRQTANGTEYGYVWKTEWDTPTDAQQFETAYRAILTAHDARSVGPHAWVIDSGAFADAYKVVRTGETVTIVNGPTPASLDQLKPGLGTPTPTPSPTPSPTPTAVPPTASPTPTTPASTPTPGSPTRGTQPGFGFLAAIAALGVAAWAARRRR